MNVVFYYKLYKLRDDKEVEIGFWINSTDGNVFFWETARKATFRQAADGDAMATLYKLSAV